MSDITQSKPLRIAFGLIGLLLVIKMFGGGDESPETEFKIKQPGAKNSGTIYDIEADSPKDTLNAMTAHLRKTQNEFSKIQEKQEKTSENQVVLKSGFDVLKKSQKKVTDTLDKVSEKIDALSSKLENQSYNTQSNDESSNDSGLNIKNDSANPFTSNTLSKPSYVTYNDIGQQQSNTAKNVVNNSSLPSQSLTQAAPNHEGPILSNRQSTGPTSSQLAINTSGSVPYFTIPENTTLVNATLFTGLLGRIPVNGVVDDPFPFTVLVGGENLAAMGFKIPGVRGMMMRGKAKGDLTLSCVRGEIISATFVFDDGTIKTLHGSTGSPLAVLEDRQGLPCVPGKLISNAGKFITIRALLGGLKGLAGAGAIAETTNSIGLGGAANSAVTGDSKKYLLNSMGSSAANESIKWWNDRNKQSFDVIFVKPNTKLSLSIQTEMRIDLDKGGRKVIHREQKRRAQYKQTGMD